MCCLILLSQPVKIPLPEPLLTLLDILQDILHAGWGQMGVLIAYQIGLLGRRRVGGILEEMQPIPAVFQLVIQLIADPTCPTVKRKKKKNQG